MTLPPYTTRIYFDDTDAAGIVYHANYLRIFERARNDSFLAAGFDHLENYQDTGESFVVSSIAIDYKSPARLGDVVNILSTMEYVGKVRINIGQTMVLDGKVLAKLSGILVWVGSNGKPKRMTADMIQLISNLR